MIGYKDIEARDLFELVKAQKVNLVDVRNDDEVARGMISGATHIPLSRLPVYVKDLEGYEPLVFYCHSGIRSAQAAAFIASKGREDVYHLVGGVLAWGKADLPFVSR